MRGRIAAGADIAAAAETQIGEMRDAALTILYSEPEGFTKHFYWETTIDVNGRAVSTQMIIE